MTKTIIKLDVGIKKVDAGTETNRREIVWDKKKDERALAKNTRDDH